MNPSSSLLLVPACILLAAAVACGATSPPSAEHGSLEIPPLASGDAGAVRPTSTEAPPDPIEASSIVAVAARDPRIASRKPQSRAKILSEVQGLERLLDATRKDAPDRASLHRRLAEGYNELASTSSGGDSTRARADSIKHYAALVKDHGSEPDLDEAYYYLGLAYELTGDLRNARSSYYELIKRWPSSKLIPLAYFAFGEMFYAEAASDPTKNDLASQAYIESLKYPSPANPVVADALLRLGDVYRRQGNTSKAKETFAKLNREFPNSPAAKQAATSQP